MAAIIFLIDVCGQIGLQDDWTKALTDQSTNGDLALLEVTSNGRVEVRRPEGDQGAASDVVGIWRGAISGSMKVSFQAARSIG